MGKKEFLAKVEAIIREATAVRRSGVHQQEYHSRTRTCVRVVGAQVLPMVRDAIVATGEKERREEKAAAIQAIDEQTLVALAPGDRRLQTVLKREIRERATQIIQVGHEEGLIKARVGPDGKVLAPLDWEYTTSAEQGTAPVGGIRVRVSRAKK